VNLEDIQAVIDSAVARGDEPLRRFVAKRLPEASEDEVEEAAAVAQEVIESVPILLARASQAARDKNLEPVVDPLLAHATRYFLQPVDLIPEMTQGLAGLLDDTYLIFRMLENLEKGPERLVAWDLDHPIRLLRRLLEPAMARQLDAIALLAMQEVEHQLSAFYDEMGHPA
jgi:uncharacterized membrane protein YkvA (DUF1232 family)